jgi:hypothetical protein
MSLRFSAARYAAARAELEKATNDLERDIRQASKDGQSLRKIAEEAGLSHQRVHQVAGGKG